VSYIGVAYHLLVRQPHFIIIFFLWRTYTFGKELCTGGKSVKIVQIRRTRLFYSVAILLLMSIIFGLLSFEYIDEQELATIENQPNTAPKGTMTVIVKILPRLLEVYSDGVLYKKYRIAVGKSKTPTPIGEWNIVWKAYDWGTGFGTRWMGLNVPWGIYGIHGTNKPWSIGQFASHGCIRMRNKDVEELFDWLPIGTPVRVEGHKIKVERSLKYQMVGSDVALVQMKLKELGYFQGRADGIFGMMTKQAIEVYQAEHSMEVTGVITKQMAELLGL
jgi:hypothetical protein